MHRMPTVDYDSGDSTLVDVVVVENGGFKCYKPAELDEAQSHPLSSSQPVHDKGDASSVNSDLEMNDVAGRDPTTLPTNPRGGDGWRRFVGWHYVRRFGDLSEKQKHLEDNYWRDRWCGHFSAFYPILILLILFNVFLGSAPNA